MLVVQIRSARLDHAYLHFLHGLNTAGVVVVHALSAELIKAKLAHLLVFDIDLTRRRLICDCLVNLLSLAEQVERVWILLVFARHAICCRHRALSNLGTLVLRAAHVVNGSIASLTRAEALQEAVRALSVRSDGTDDVREASSAVLTTLTSQSKVMTLIVRSFSVETHTESCLVLDGSEAGALSAHSSAGEPEVVAGLHIGG